MREQAGKARRVVIKIGSSILTGGRDRLDERFIGSLARQVAMLRDEGRQVVIVSSGAVAAGMMVLDLAERPKDVADKQAVAACGQGYLIHRYSARFARHSLTVAQILLTSDDITNRSRYLNARNTVENLLARSVVPIINENDTVSTKEIKIGDNDNLSAEVACLTGADLLVILSDVAGLYDKDPAASADARIIPVVHSVEKHLRKASDRAGSSVGTGGIFTKLQAARRVMTMGIPMVLALGRKKDVVSRILAGADEGTLFLPAGKQMSNRDYFIAFNMKPKGVLTVDAGARRAVVEMGRSLLPSGIISTEGSFRVGDVVEVAGPDGQAVARGFTNYSAPDLRMIMGRKSSEIEGILGSTYDDEVIHRNNMVVICTLGRDRE